MKRPLVILIAMVLGTATLRAQQAQPPAKPAENPEQLEARANEAWSNLPLREKMHLLKLHRALRAMPPQEREFIQERVARFLEMTPAEREQLQRNREAWQKMTPEEREKAREQFRQHRKEFEDKWRKEHPGEEPPPTPQGRRRPGAPQPTEQPQPPQGTQP